MSQLRGDAGRHIGRDATSWPGTPGEWVAFALLAVGLFGLFHATALALQSDRGQRGVLVAAIVVGALVVAERLISRSSLRQCVADLGLGAPSGRGMVLAVALGGGLLAVVPLYAWSVGADVGFVASWSAALVGLFAQAGLAEEALFRGFLFRRVRTGRTFGRAVVLSSWPFVLAHLPLFATLPWQLAAASLALAVSMSYSLARLFELGGSTVWPPALVHFVVQGIPKVLALDALPAGFPLVWIAASGLVTSVTVLWGLALGRRELPSAAAVSCRAVGPP